MQRNYAAIHGEMPWALLKLPAHCMAVSSMELIRGVPGLSDHLRGFGWWQGGTARFATSCRGPIQVGSSASVCDGRGIMEGRSLTVQGRKQLPM